MLNPVVVRQELLCWLKRMKDTSRSRNYRHVQYTYGYLVGQTEFYVVVNYQVGLLISRILSLATASTTLSWRLCSEKLS